MASPDSREIVAADDYFSLLLERALSAGQEGNYAIAAALSLRDAGGEIVVFGQNTLQAQRDPLGHAEMNAIRRTHRVTRARDEREALIGQAARDGWLLLRRPGAPGRDLVLYATLEPCPMCTVALLNAGVDRVVIATADPLAGALAAERLARLPSLWREIAQRVEVVWAQSDDPKQTESYVSRETHSALLQAFENSRVGLDEKLLADGVLDRQALREVVRSHSPVT